MTGPVKCILHDSTIMSRKKCICLNFCTKKLYWSDVWSVTNPADILLLLTKQDSQKVALKMTLLAFIV